MKALIFKSSEILGVIWWLIISIGYAVFCIFVEIGGLLKAIFWSMITVLSWIISSTGLLVVIVWILFGFAGYIMYLSNPNTRPKRIFFYPIALLTHCSFGLIGLVYGYICFSSRGGKLKFSNKRGEWS